MRRDWELKLKWNIAVFYWIYRTRIPILEQFYKVFYHLGKGYSLPLFLGFFYFYSLSLLPIIIIMILVGIILPIIKMIFRHWRPAKLLKDVENFEGLRSRSFPSADAAYAFAIFFIIVFNLSWFWIVSFALYALLISHGRIYMGAHFPLDVMTGALIALSVVTIVYSFY